MIRSSSIKPLEERKGFIMTNEKTVEKDIKCNEDSLAGVVSQRACVYSGARVVLNPITDAYHLVHGPIGCASYTWDIRGSLSSGAEVYRNSFSTDLGEKDIIFGGECKLSLAIKELVERYQPELIFVYSTCVVGVIGDDLSAVCKSAEREYGIKVVPVQSTGFASNKISGYRAACDALMDLIKENNNPAEEKEGINILGDYNLAAEMWILQGYFQQLGIKVVAKFTGDSSYQEIKKATKAKLNIVQCAGSMGYLGKEMEKEFGIPFIKVSFFGVKDTVDSLRKIADFLGDRQLKDRVEKFVREQSVKVKQELEFYRQRLKGSRAAIYVGGGFKAISLIKQFNDLGIETVMVGTQTGKKEEYREMKELSKEGTVILDDANPSELENFMKERGADILVGGVKDRALAYKMGIAFCDHNHERKHPLSGFEGVINFAKELDMTINSPVWQLLRSDIND
ncbi:MAG: nitrogenase iron-molybdenum cofactor biosynthesis protein NifE [Firmicutes bacterium]|nr:nitrogenase iron-molybdenum cofactor biosynthesis protein NifE [Bacillota bacterium]